MNLLMEIPILLALCPLSFGVHQMKDRIANCQTDKRVFNHGLSHGGKSKEQLDLELTFVLIFSKF